jgi:pimeloyl-ACP methyl ester carboxylesterase
MILVAAMVPSPGETPGDWWANTGHAEARREAAQREGWGSGRDDDLATTFFHDVPSDIAAEAMVRGRRQSATPFRKPWPLPAWPAVPTEFLLCRQDRMFPAEFQRRVVKDRLGIVADEMDGGHLPALARPDELAARILSYGPSGRGQRSN